MTLLFKIHYFLWYGGHTSIFGYESVYARYYTNATTVQFGTLRMILPFVAVIVTPIVCLNADRSHKHRLYFTVSLMIALISLMAYTLLPLTMMIDEQEASISPTPLGLNNSAAPVKHYRRYNWIGERPKQASTSQEDATRSINPSSDLWLGPFVYYCLVSMVFELALAVNTCLSDSYAVLQAEAHGTTFGRMIVWGTFGWAFSALVLSIINQSAIKARLLPGLLFGVGLLAIDSIMVSLWYRDEDFKLDFLAMEAARSLTGSSSSGHRKPSDYMPFNEANLINMGAVVGRTPNLRRRIKIKRSSEIFLGDVTDGPPGSGPRTESETSSHVVTLRSPMSPRCVSPTSQISPRSPLTQDIEPTRSPMSMAMKTVATINSEFSAIDHPQNTMNVTNNKPDEIIDPYSKKVTQATPADAAALIDLSNLVIPSQAQAAQQLGGINTKLTNKSKDQPPLKASLKIQLNLFYLILKRRKSLVRYLLMFILSGVFMSMQWNYFFLYLEDSYRSQFELISALSMVCQSILGELPFFILSRKVIDRFGRSHTLSISMISIGVRFMIYRFLLRPTTCMYYVFLADCLQGPTYGLFYVVMTEVGLEYSYCDDATLGQLIKMNLLDGANQIQVDAVRLALRSTVQSIAFACYEGLGVGLGSLLGGVMLQYYNFDALWFWTAVCAISLGLVNASIEMFCREQDLSDGSEASQRLDTTAVPASRLSSSAPELVSQAPPLPIPVDRQKRALASSELEKKPV